MKGYLLLNFFDFLKIWISSCIAVERFELDEWSYKFRYDFGINRYNVRSIYYGTETASFMGQKHGQRNIKKCYNID